MSEWIFYHNPRCQKSREALKLLHDRGVQPLVIEYLQSAPGEKTLRSLVEKLGLPVKELVRKKEKEFKELKARGFDLNDELAVYKALADNPILLERPIVVKGNKAVLGRPPENVLTLLGPAPAPEAA